MIIILALGGLALISGWLLMRRRRQHQDSIDLDGWLSSGKTKPDEEVITVCSFSSEDPIYGTRIRMSKPVRKD
jgi:hypothetical protein